MATGKIHQKLWNRTAKKNNQPNEKLRGLLITVGLEALFANLRVYSHETQLVNPDDLIKSATGGVVGFMLAQFVNLVALAWKHWRRPVLVIEPASDNALIVSDSVHYANHPDMLSRRVFGFYVKNSGRSVAKDVQFQITKIETRRREDTEYSPVSESTHQLGIYTGADGNYGATSVTLAPKTAALVRLGSWREDTGVIWPAISEQIDYHEEANSDAVDWRFTVIAFDSDGTYTTAQIDITFRKKR